MQYLLLICGEESRLNSDQRMAAWGAFTQELAAAGKVRGGERLRPAATATTLRLKNAQPLLTDGPYAETKEQLGGFYVIEAADLDEAVSWAQKMPHLQDGGSVEVRPIWPMGDS
jgi:hypothetical protein